MSGQASHLMVVHFALTTILVSLSVLLLLKPQISLTAPPNDAQRASTCKREILNANKTLSAWAETLESMVNESKLPASSRESVHKAANQVLDSIEDWGQRLESQPSAQLARDLVQIRRNSNRMSLEIYLHTLDMRWPTNSLQIGLLVERVQQACLDRKSIQALESDPNPIGELEIMNRRAGNGAIGKSN